jgi:hypothetical protein
MNKRFFIAPHLPKSSAIPPADLMIETSYHFSEHGLLKKFCNLYCIRMQLNHIVP